MNSSAPQANLKTRTARGLHQRTQKTQTLMRGTLKKPAISSSKPKNRPSGFNPLRELRAKQTVKHSKVDRFGGFASTFKSPSKSSPPTLLKGEIINRPKLKQAEPGAAATVLPSMVTSASHHRLERMLDEALAKADSHKEALKYQAARHFWQRPGFFEKKRWLKLSGIAAAIIIAGLIIAWQKVPVFSMKLASLRSHVDASIPDYKPAGYKFDGPAKTFDHTVSIKYASAADSSKTYTVQEQASDQDSQSLIADSSSPNQAVQTAQANGIPIVIVQNKLKCVSNGIETTITNQAGLSPDELLNIAKSICA